jgi:hypothetical protein
MSPSKKQIAEVNRLHAGARANLKGWIHGNRSVGDGVDRSALTHHLSRNLNLVRQFQSKIKSKD